MVGRLQHDGLTESSWMNNLKQSFQIIKFIASFVAWHALRVVFATEFRSAEEPEEILLLLPQSIRNQYSYKIPSGATRQTRW